ncbi:MAG: tol-pal system protein YbgF [Hyphomicrobiaceae bacterium]|nr:tol-pal system protein YbgF [Hyphomicrobiaceae bacterium]MCC0024176.1 tol-pal system protein YbgF [Hyphomicrobiaceae bacterium]
MPHILRGRAGRSGLFATILLAGIAAPAIVGAEGNADLDGRLSILEQQTQMLSDSLSGLGAGQIGNGPIVTDQGVMVAQSRDLAALNVRVQQLEEQLRTLTGQVEGVQFQMTQVYEQIERMIEDNDFRFKQLEGALGKTDAVTQSGGAMPSGELPQTQTNDSTVDLGGADEVIDPTFDQPMDMPADGGTLDLGNGGGGVGDSQDPLLGTVDQPMDGVLETAPLGGQPLVLSMPENGGVTFGGGTLDQGQALQLDFDPGKLVTTGDAEAQYQAGFNAVQQGDYDFAIAQFSQFVELFPNDPHAPDASNWLGESLLQKGAYEQAAEVFFDGYQKYPDSTRAPDMLLKLGVALNGAGEHDTACRTFSEVLRRYPNMGGAFADRVNQEMAQAQC